MLFVTAQAASDGHGVACKACAAAFGMGLLPHAVLTGIMVSGTTVGSYPIDLDPDMRRCPMAYNEFTLDMLKSRFHLTIIEDTDFFAAIPAVPISDGLVATLHDHIPLALAISTEKARSELIITPILIEVWRQMQRRVSLFSGVEFTVDPEKGLKGVCDYLFSLSREQLTIEAPVVAVVEAKNENMKQGISQCIAEMVAAQVFNARRNNELSTIYGVVTTGSNWRFLRLIQQSVFIDLREYFVNDLAQIVGILRTMMDGALAEVSASSSA
jgi:hypothetical protein